MQLVSYLMDGKSGCGRLDGDTIHSFGSSSLLSFIEKHQGSTSSVVQGLAREEKVTGRKFDLNRVTLQAPIPRPTSMRDGYAFRQHVLTARKNRGLDMIPEFDLFPVFYFTNHQAVFGPGEILVQEKHLDKLDYELETAIVTCGTGMNLTAASADDIILGYAIMNDWSARTLQMEEMKLNLGPAKGKDFATSLGPVLVTRDELKEKGLLKSTVNGEVMSASMTASINGEVYSKGDMNSMNWTFAQLLERVSYGVQVFPGEVIGSGTVGTGCLLELNGSKVTDNLWLKVGDVVDMEVQGLGRLTNKIALRKG